MSDEVEMQQIDIFSKLQEITAADTPTAVLSERARQIANHRLWLQSIRRERPNTARPFKVGIYIRYFNQTRYENYLDYHKKQLEDTINLCPKWTLVDFYIDEGAVPPNVESAPELSRLLRDCTDGKPNLPSLTYYDVVATGYKEIGLDLSYLEGALKDTQQKMGQ